MQEFKHLFWNLDKPSIDLLNALIYLYERSENYIGPMVDELAVSTVIDTTLHEIASILGFLKLDDVTKTHIIDTLEVLNNNMAHIIIQHNEDRYVKKITFVQEIVLSSTNKDLNKRITLWVSNTLLKILRAHKELFEMLYAFATFNIKSKYTMILYNHLVDKSEDMMSVQDVMNLFDYNLDSNDNLTNWSRFSTNVLKRSVTEINEKTNLKITYDRIKGEDELIRFHAKKFSNKNLGRYLDDETVTARKVAYFIEREVIKRIEKIQNIKPADYIEDPEKYASKIRKNLKADIEEYEARVYLMDLLNHIKYQEFDKDGVVAIKLDGRLYTVNNAYKLFDYSTKQVLTNNAKETRSKIELLKNKGVEDIYQIVTLEKYMKDCSISYTKG